MGKTLKKEDLLRPSISWIQHYRRPQRSNERKPQIKLNIVETRNPDDFNKGIFAHSRVGKNVDPKSKIDEFAKFTEQGIGENADIAFFKFCYVDVRSETDSQKVFDDYKKSMSNLTKKYPKTNFIHVTVPLKQKQNKR